MVRTHQFLHVQRPAAPTRLAATVLLLRDSLHGLQVLMTRRSTQASFAPGAYVFPGGGIDEADAAAHDIAQRRPGQSDESLTHAVAAIRESFEELGVLLARHADGHWVTSADIATMDRQKNLADQCRTRGLTLATEGVFTLARWLTDRDLARRFDVPFLIARMPEGQTPVADEKEQFEPVWVSPGEALARHEAGEFFMIFPTIRTLERLKAWSHVQEALDACSVSEEPLWTSCPRGGWLQGREERFMEHDAPYGELDLVSPDGQLVHHLDWQSERPVPLLRNVLRLTAPNPGFMTGPGTNSYLVGDPHTGHIVIDPGPADEEHLQKLWHVAGGHILAIVCTHSHADHSPGAAVLQALCTEPRPPIYGLPSRPTARANSFFRPDQELSDGQTLILRGQTAEGPISHTLRAIWTPGHAANHLCLVLEEDGLLFSGDHILNGSTTVIDPPDGHMGDYLASLDRLHDACQTWDIRYILPAHGHVLGFARQAIAHLKAHRLKREARIAAAMQALPHGSLQDWVAHAYADVPQRLWPVAARSLQAHVDHLREQASAPRADQG